MTKPTSKEFPKITIKLTQKQQEVLAPFEKKVNGGFVGDDGDHRYVALGQAWFVGDKAGTVDIHLINAAAYQIINRAIMRARKTCLK